MMVTGLVRLAVGGPGLTPMKVCKAKFPKDPDRHMKIITNAEAKK